MKKDRKTKKENILFVETSIERNDERGHKLS